MFSTYQHHQYNLIKKREAFQKGKFNSKTAEEKLCVLEKEVKDAEMMVEESKKDFQALTLSIKEEFDRFDVRKVADLKSIAIKYIENSISLQEKVFYSVNSRLSILGSNLIAMNNNKSSSCHGIRKYAPSSQDLIYISHYFLHPPSKLHIFHTILSEGIVKRATR